MLWATPGPRVFIDYDKAEARRRGAPLDAESLLRMPTFFGQCDELRATNAELRELMGMWQQTKLELQQDAAVRAELLKVAVQRWNSVMDSLAQVGDAQEKLGKLSGIIEQFAQHSQMID